MKALILVAISILLFSGCKEPEPEPALETKVVYVKAKQPKQRYLNTVPNYNISVEEHNKQYYKVQKYQLERASDTSKLLRKQTIFYKNQVITYNKKFAIRSK